MMIDGKIINEIQVNRNQQFIALLYYFLIYLKNENLVWILKEIQNSDGGDRDWKVILSCAI